MSCVNISCVVLNIGMQTDSLEHVLISPLPPYLGPIGVRYCVAKAPNHKQNATPKPTIGPRKQPAQWALNLCPHPHPGDLIQVMQTRVAGAAAPTSRLSC
jgi:hypothetical protein